MTRSVVIGSGPAAAGAVLALANDPTQQVTVIDIGYRLEPALRVAVARLAGHGPSGWDQGDVDLISRQPVDDTVKGLPQKRAYGSDFPFRNVGQLDGVTALGQANVSVISGAYGGLSNVWGSQVMVFTPATFAQWPVSSHQMEPHYRAVLDAIPYSGEEDALARHFPLVGKAQPLPQLAPRAQLVIKSAERQQHELDRIGVTVGRARLAFGSAACVRCGLCMTGCPYSLIYSASDTFDQLRRNGRIQYHNDLMAIEVGQDGDAPYALARHLGSQTVQRFEADRLYLAAGALGTTRLVLGSLRLFGQEVELAESVQFVLPMLSARPTPDPRLRTEFTLNQFNMAITTDKDWLNVSQIHFYPYNHAILEALPKALTAPWAAPATNQLVRRLTIGLGYLPSWVSPPLRVRAEQPRGDRGLPDFRVAGELAQASRIPMFRRVVTKVLQAAPRLDLWPVLPMMFFSAAGKSYHFGGSFPHSDLPADGPLTTDRWGRLGQWSRVHLVDASVFPTVPATTFTLTIMANAHRIASETLGMTT